VSPPPAEADDEELPMPKGTCGGCGALQLVPNCGKPRGTCGNPASPWKGATRFCDEAACEAKEAGDGHDKH
jgi:membrane protease subunit (stomatin/prohibitin family)